jgi:hypothetical protein
MTGPIKVYLENIAARSRAIARFFELRMSAVAVAWLVIVGLAILPRLLFPLTPVAGLGGAIRLMTPYVLIALAPIAGYLVASGSFPRGLIAGQPQIRFAIYGRWRALGVIEARQNPAYGPAGFMASLLVGLLLNVVVRTFEFLLSMPAMGGSAPLWGDRLFGLMAADVVIMSFFYMVCFVMALRTVPLFPRMLLFAWCVDVAMQLVIAGAIMATPGVPAMVSAPLHGLLQGNITKVLISAFVWLPYLILSDRVNVTYRRRVRATS